MEGPKVAPEIIDFYASVYDEATRLSQTAHGTLEFVRTQELLREHLPAAPATVLDVGGGPGTHAQWLVPDGYAVHLVDPVERHLRQAQSVCACTAELGDARALPAEGGTYDAALLLGPLYHLPDRPDRLQTLREARRVLRPGGVVAAAAICRHATLLDMAATARLGPASARTIKPLLDSGRYNGEFGFTIAYFHTVAELSSEVTEAGFTDIRLYGIEGPAWPALKGVESYTGESLINSPLFASALTAARVAGADPALLAASSHLMAVGSAPAGARLPLVG